MLPEREDPVSATFKRIAVIRALKPAQLFAWQPGLGWEPDLDNVVRVLDAGTVTRSWGLGSPATVDTDGQKKTFIILKAGDVFVFARPDDFEVLNQHRLQ